MGRIWSAYFAECRARSTVLEGIARARRPSPAPGLETREASRLPGRPRYRDSASRRFVSRKRAGTRGLEGRPVQAPRAHLSRARGRVGSAGRPDARRADEANPAEPVAEEAQRSRRPSAAPTRRAGPICFASPRRSSSTCRSVDTTSSSLLVLLAPRPGAAPFPAGMSSFVRLSSRRMRCGRFGRPTSGLPSPFPFFSHSSLPHIASARGGRTLREMNFPDSFFAGVNVSPVHGRSRFPASSRSTDLLTYPYSRLSGFSLVFGGVRGPGNAGEGSGSGLTPNTRLSFEPGKHV